MKKDLDVIFKEEVHDLIIESYNFYEDKSDGLGERFLNSIANSLKSIQKSPNGFKKVDKFRQIPILKFPFVIIYEVFESSLVIYAIFHTKQNPVKKLKRKK